MALSALGTSYAAQSLGMAPAATGAQDIGQVLRNQLSQVVKRRQIKQNITTQPTGAASFDLLGKATPSG